MILALEESGRHVSLFQLSDWRKEGMLPPLANRGLGQARGKSYYWNEENIVLQAQCVHDLLARHGRQSVAILILWLCGYPISLVKVRRVWLQRSKRPKTWQLRSALTNGLQDLLTWPQEPTRNRADAVLLRTVITLCGSFAAGQRSETEVFYKTLQGASETLGYATGSADEVPHRVFTIFSVVLSAIESSSLLHVANEEDMQSARQLTAASVGLLQTLTEGNAEASSPMEHTRLMEVLGPSFFLCILLLQRTGYHTLLGRSLIAVETLRATLPRSTRSDRDKFLVSFREQLAKIWSSATVTPAQRAPRARQPSATF